MYMPQVPEIITVHRCTIRKDLIEVFKNPNINNSIIDIRVIDARGKAKLGQGKGVILDVLTHFWH